MSWIEPWFTVNWSLAIGLALGAYALGCFSTGYYLVRWRTGQDVRDLGSGSVGAKNVGRMLGKTGFTFTLAGDFAKGAFAVWAAREYAHDERLVALAMVAVVAGHIWPAQLRFHGGKGVAASLGALLCYDPHLAAAFAILFAGAFGILRKLLLPGLIAFACLPVVGAYLMQERFQVANLAIVAAMIWAAHRKNLLDEVLHPLTRSEIRPNQNQSEL